MLLDEVVEVENGEVVELDDDTLLVGDELVETVDEETELTDVGVVEVVVVVDLVRKTPPIATIRMITIIATTATVRETALTFLANRTLEIKILGNLLSRVSLCVFMEFAKVENSVIDGGFYSEMETGAFLFMDSSAAKPISIAAFPSLADTRGVLFSMMQLTKSSTSS